MRGRGSPLALAWPDATRVAVTAGVRGLVREAAVGLACQPKEVAAADTATQAATKPRLTHCTLAARAESFGLDAIRRVAGSHEVFSGRLDEAVRSADERGTRVKGDVGHECGVDPAIDA